MTDISSSASVLLRLLRYARGYRKRVWLASSCSVLNKLFDVMPEILIGMAIDVVVRQEHSFLADFGILEPFNQMLFLGAITIMVWALESLFEFLLLILWRNLSQSLQHDLRLDAYGHVQDLDMAWFEDSSTGALVAMLNDDVNQLETVSRWRRQCPDPGGDFDHRGWRGIFLCVTADCADGVHTHPGYRPGGLLVPAPGATAVRQCARESRFAQCPAGQQYIRYCDHQEFYPRTARTRTASQRKARITSAPTAAPSVSVPLLSRSSAWPSSRVSWRP